jgi:hypothetical protein
MSAEDFNVSEILNTLHDEMLERRAVREAAAHEQEQLLERKLAALREVLRWLNAQRKKKCKRAS